MMPQGLALRWLWGAAATLLAVSALFVMTPDLDLVVSRMFGDNAGFPIAESAVWEGIRSLLRIATDLPALFALVLAVLAVIGLRFGPMAPLALWFYALSYILIPGVLVNWILKANSGRARPRNLMEFGGDKTFSPAWQIADQCPVNCSFVSGEASALAATATLLTLLFWARAGRGWLIALWSIALFGSLLRVAFGGHFLSDVLIAMTLTTTLILGLYIAARPLRRV